MENSLVVAIVLLAETATAPLKISNFMAKNQASANQMVMFYNAWLQLDSGVTVFSFG